MTLRDARGTVFAEFLMAFPLVFLLFLGITQLCLLSVALLVVQHAAYRAARQGALVLDDDPAEYDGAPRMQLRVETDAEEDEGEGVLSLVSASGSSAQSGEEDSGRGPRMDSVVSAARLPLGALAPPLRLLRGWLSNETAGLGEGSFDTGAGRLATAVIYTPLATDVTIEGKPDESPLVFVPDELLRVHVAYVYACSVPIANRLVCRGLLDALGLGVVEDLPFGPDRLPLDEIRYMTLHGHAAAPIHHAHYAYRSEHEEQ